MKLWEHRILNIMNVSLPIIFAMILSCLLTAKLFNLEVPFDITDYALIIVSIFIIFLFQRERWIELNKEFVKGVNKE